jgi:hypothetical protein
VDPVPDPLLFLVVPGIEPGPPELKPRTLTTRPHTNIPRTCQNACLPYVVSNEENLMTFSAVLMLKEVTELTSYPQGTQSLSDNHRM